MVAASQLGPWQVKYGTRASSGGGRASARETIGRVAAGAVAEKSGRPRAATGRTGRAEEWWDFPLQMALKCIKDIQDHGKRLETRRFVMGESRVNGIYDL